MNIRLWLVVIMIGMGMNLLSQPYPSSRKHLQQLIKEGNEQKDLKTYSLLACNEDSMFYMHDTLYFYDNAKYFDEVVNCCEFLEWEFLSDNIIRQQEPLTCLEPSNVLLSSMRYYKYKVTKRKKLIFLDIMLDKKMLASYLVRNIEYIELPKEESCRAITLIRQRHEVLPSLDESDKVILSEQQEKSKIDSIDQTEEIKIDSLDQRDSNKNELQVQPDTKKKKRARIKYDPL
jgi:hypothetical protein